MEIENKNSYLYDLCFTELEELLYIKPYDDMEDLKKDLVKKVTNKIKDLKYDLFPGDADYFLTILEVFIDGEILYKNKDGFYPTVKLCNVYAYLDCVRDVLEEEGLLKEQLLNRLNILPIEDKDPYDIGDSQLSRFFLESTIKTLDLITDFDLLIDSFKDSRKKKFYRKGKHNERTN